jgi:hypothetical protein
MYILSVDKNPNRFFVLRYCRRLYSCRSGNQRPETVCVLVFIGPGVLPKKRSQFSGVRWDILVCQGYPGGHGPNGLREVGVGIEHLDKPGVGQLSIEFVSARQKPVPFPTRLAAEDIHRVHFHPVQKWRHPVEIGVPTVEKAKGMGDETEDLISKRGQGVLQGVQTQAVRQLEIDLGQKADDIKSFSQGEFQS